MFWLDLVWTRSCSHLQEVDGFLHFFRNFSECGIRLILRLGDHFLEVIVNLVEEGFIKVMVRWLTKVFKMFDPAFKDPVT